MATFPALPVFTDAISSDCAHLNDAEFGLYFRILMLMWRSPDCRIPNDEAWITRKLQRPWNQIKPLLDEFCTSSGNWWTQKRLKKEWEYLIERRKNNKNAANKRWGNSVDNDDASRVGAGVGARGDFSTVPDNQLNLPDFPLSVGNAPHSTPLHSTDSVVKTSTQQEPAKPEVLKKFDVKDSYTDAALSRIRGTPELDGWCPYHLAELFNENVNSNKLSKPDHPIGALIGWAKKYTKNNKL